MTVTALPKLLTRKEASEITRNSVAWYERAAWSQTGPPFIKIGNKPLYPEDQLLEWIKSRPTGGGKIK